MAAQANSLGSTTGGGMSRALYWARKGALAVADQGLISGSNFALGVLLARWLPAAEYGAYALAFSLFLLGASVHQALLLEPMSVLGSSTFSDRAAQYRGALLKLHALFSVLVFAILSLVGLGAWFTGNPALAMAMFGLAAGAPGVLLLWVTRMSCYIESRAADAASGAVAYCLLMVAALAAQVAAGWLSPASVFLAMGVCSALASVWVLRKHAVIWRDSAELSIVQVWREHWNYGRWAIGSFFVIWFPCNVFYSIVGAIVGIGGAGVFRALMNLTFPMSHTSTALSLVFQPNLSRVAARDGHRATFRPVFGVMALYAGVAAVYCTLMSVESDTVIRVLYSGRYQEAARWIPWMLGGVIFQVAAYAPAVGLRALQRPSDVFKTYTAGAFVSLAAGIPATMHYGVPGAVIAFAASLLAGFVVGTVLYLRALRAPVVEEGNR